MDKFFEKLIDKTDVVVVNGAVIFIILFVGYLLHVWLRSIVTVLEKNVSAQATADNLISLQKEYNELNRQYRVLWDKYNQNGAILTGIRNVYSELKYILYLFADFKDITANADALLKLITDRLASDLKYFAGELHRCAIWVPIDDRSLIMYVASAGFPDYYRRSRTLEIDGSVAGRCYRTKTSVYIPDVRGEREFKHDPNSAHAYYSLICVPLTFGEICLGVISIDGRAANAFTQADVEIVETYAEIVKMIRIMQIASAVAETREGGDL